MEEEVYYHDVKKNEDEVKREDDTEDQKQMLNINSPEKYNIFKEYNLEEHQSVKVNHSGRSRLPSISRSLLESSGCLLRINEVGLFLAVLIFINNI